VASDLDVSVAQPVKNKKLAKQTETAVGIDFMGKLLGSCKRLWRNNRDQRGRVVTEYK
jgi:hypothetical protein